MKFKINQSEIVPVLGTLVKLIPSKPTLEAYGAFLFTVKGKNLKITASDGETSLCYSLKTESDATEETRFLIDACLLNNASKELPKVDIDFTYNEEKSRLLVDWGTGKSSLPTSRADSYPTPAKITDGTTLECDAKTFFKSCTETVFAAEEDEMRPVMCGVLVDIVGDKTTLVASNGRILSTSNPTQTKASGEGKFLVHHKPMGLLSVILSKAEGTLKMQFGEKNAKFLVGNCLMCVRLIQGKYPAYRSIWPDEKDASCTIEIKKNEILGSIRRMGVYKSKDYNTVSLKVEKGAATLSTSDKAVAKAKEMLNCNNCNGADLTISFNIDYLENAVSRLPYEDIKLCIKNAASAVILANAEKKEDNSTEMIIMPSFAA